MGQSSAKQDGRTSQTADQRSIAQRAERRLGALTVAGRVHGLPRSVDHDYALEKARSCGLSAVFASPASSSPHGSACSQISSPVSSGPFFPSPGSHLGSGSQGRAAVNRRNPQLCVEVRHVDFRDMGCKRRQLAEAEAEVLLAMDHPHVQRLLALYEGEGCMDLILERVDGPDLVERLESSRSRSLGETEAAQVLRQVLLAVAHLHGRRLAHRDLKLESFRFESAKTAHLKLAQFPRCAFWKLGAPFTEDCVSMEYAAPEVLSNKYSQAADIWSVGVIAFVLLAGSMPFGGSGMARSIARGEYDFHAVAWSKLSFSAMDFVRDLLVVNASERVTAAKAVQHSWIQRYAPRRSSAITRPVLAGLQDHARASRLERACLLSMAWSLGREEQAKVRDAFLELDSGGKSYIDFNDIRQAELRMRKLPANEKQPQLDEEITSIFDALDPLLNRCMYYTNFLAAMCGTRIAYQDGHLQEAFRRFDCSEPGHISPESIAAILGRPFEGAEPEDILCESEFAHGASFSELRLFMQAEKAPLLKSQSVPLYSFTIECEDRSSVGRFVLMPALSLAGCLILHGTHLPLLHVLNTKHLIGTKKVMGSKHLLVTKHGELAGGPTFCLPISVLIGMVTKRVCCRGHSSDVQM